MEVVPSVCHLRVHNKNQQPAGKVPEHQYLTLNVVSYNNFAKGLDTPSRDKDLLISEKECNRPMTLEINRGPAVLVPNVPSDHTCYILRSTVANRIYIGYTVNFPRRIRQHNGEIVGGAKRTKRWRPWMPVCIIRGFYESSSALRFEYRLQHPHKRKRAAGQDSVSFILGSLGSLINNGDGSRKNNNKMPWPHLFITWCNQLNYSIHHPNVTNLYS